MQGPVLLDKQFAQDLEADLGKIGIRVVVFSKKKDSSAASDDDQPADLEAEEDFTSSDSEVNSFLELPKRGKLCCVFLINGQRQDGLDNAFIVSDLKMKYLRKRMIIVVDLDGLSQRAIAEIMQGSRAGFFRGQVYHKICERVAATLRGDPDLLDLEDEAEEELSQLQAGEAAVQEALNQLIDHHFDFSEQHAEGSNDPAGKLGHFFGPDGKPAKLDVVTFGENGVPVTGAVLLSNHAADSLRIPPNTKATLRIAVAPKSEVPNLVNMMSFVDPATPGLACNLISDAGDQRVEIEFTEPSGFDAEEYPVEATLRVLATFKDQSEPRLLTKEVIIRPRTKRPPQPPKILNDEPTYIKVASRQPVRLTPGGPDTHVRLSWDGKDSLTFEPNPQWTFTGACTTHTDFPLPTFTKPTNGRFEALIHTPAEILVGTKLEFEVHAHGPGGKTLSAKFIAEAVALPGPKKIQAEVKSDN